MMLALGGALVAAASFALLAAVMDEQPVDAGKVSSRQALEPQRDAPPPPEQKLAARMDAAVADEMLQRPHADLSSMPPFEVSLPLVSIDGSGFRRGEDMVRFDRVSGPRASDVCADGEQRWACGLQARAALHNLVAGRTMLCQPRRVLTGGGIAADCRLKPKDAMPRGDIARLLVRLGWAQPAKGSEAEFAAEMAEARAAGAGLWRGGWRVLTP